MKSRIPLTPEMAKIIREEVENQIKLERGWNSHATLLVAVWTMGNDFGYGETRLNRVYDKMLENWNMLCQEYGYDCWYDKILSDLARWGCDPREDAALLEREEKKAFAKRAAQNFTPGQQAKMKAIAEEMKGK